MGTEQQGLDFTRPLTDDEVVGPRDSYPKTHIVLVRDHRLTRVEFARFAGYLWPESPKFHASRDILES